MFLSLVIIVFFIVIEKITKAACSDDIKVTKFFLVF